ncbi:MAG TPA: DNA polymerase III subunit gamma/tau [Candidatus Saccharimonadales bacterium]|nr:DNA polymerase III subunit gamma/tau [Candidatus Saccharimonadales bacterium]
MGQALYRKYRSRSLAEVIGQEHITETLGNAIKSGRISHAYLFTGPRGTGKTSVARILAHEINKLPYSDKTQLDIIEIDAASNRRIDDIRELREKVHIAPVNAPYKVYIIDEVHMLTGESFNALLKTLEEPPEHVVFILATTESHKLPATIISRTQRFAFRLVDRAKVIGHLKNIAQKEGIKITDDALQIIAEHGGGSFRDSISLLDQISNITDDDITAQSIEQALGLAANSAVQSVLNCLLTGDHLTLGQILDDIDAQGVAPAAFVNQLSKQITNQATSHPQLYDLLDKLLDVPRAYNPRLKMLAILLSFAAQGKQGKPAKTMATQVTPAVLQTIEKIEKPKANETPQPAQAEPDQKRPTAPQIKLTSDKNNNQRDATAKTIKLDDITAEQWQQITDAVKKVNIPLHSVLKHAVPLFDAQNQKLTLAFKWQLHRKKLDDVKQKMVISQIVTEIFNGDIEVTTSLNKEASMPITSDDPTVMSVADIMGGGEIVNLDGNS